MLSHVVRKLVNRSSEGVCAEVVADGIVWRFSAAGLARWGPTGPVGMLAQAEQLVKQNLQRSIWRIAHPAGDLYLKECRVNTPRSWLRDLVRPSKAQLEFENAIRLHQRQIRTITPLAWGQLPGWLPRTSWLITAADVAQQTLLEALESLPVQDQLSRHEMTKSLAKAIASWHDAGVTHPDPHPGNFLWHQTPTGAEVVLMDLHALRFAAALTAAQTLENLVLVNRWFQMRASRTDRFRFWKAYLGQRQKWSGPALDPHRAAQELEARTEASNRRFWAARLGRYVSKNRDSGPVRRGRLTGYAVTNLPATLLDALATQPDAPFQAASGVLKNSRTSAVAMIEHDGHRYLWKRFNLKSPWLALKNRFRASPALRSWLLGNSVRDRGLPTAAPLLLLQQHRGGAATVGYVLFEWIDQAQELPQAIRRLDTHPQRRQILCLWAEKLARILRLMHDRGLSHRDLKGSNILMRGSDPWTAEPVLIDLVGMECNRPVSTRRRQRDLARLAASFLRETLITHAVRRQFLASYLTTFPIRQDSWKSWWGSILQLVEAKISRNQQSGRPLH